MLGVVTLIYFIYTCIIKSVLWRVGKLLVNLAIHADQILIFVKDKWKFFK